MPVDEDQLNDLIGRFTPTRRATETPFNVIYEIRS
jgi:hypothetical protein